MYWQWNIKAAKQFNGYLNTDVWFNSNNVRDFIEEAF